MHGTRLLVCICVDLQTDLTRLNYPQTDTSIHSKLLSLYQHPTYYCCQDHFSKVLHTCTVFESCIWVIWVIRLFRVIVSCLILSTVMGSSLRGDAPVNTSRETNQIGLRKPALHGAMAELFLAILFHPLIVASRT